MRAPTLVAFGLAAAAALVAFAPTFRPRATAPPHVAFRDETGMPVDLSAFRGKVVLLDFWATWCAPCRKEMPSLDRVQGRLGARGLAVVPVAIDFRGMEAVDAFYRELGIRNLAKYIDETRDSAKTLGFVGIPAAVAFDRQGREAFRVEGPLEWDGPAVATRLETLLAR